MLTSYIRPVKNNCSLFLAFLLYAPKQPRRHRMKFLIVLKPIDPEQAGVGAGVRYGRHTAQVRLAAGSRRAVSSLGRGRHHNEQ